MERSVPRPIEEKFITLFWVYDVSLNSVAEPQEHHLVTLFFEIPEDVDPNAMVILQWIDNDWALAENLGGSRGGEISPDGKYIWIVRENWSKYRFGSAAWFEHFFQYLERLPEPPPPSPVVEVKKTYTDPLGYQIVDVYLESPSAIDLSLPRLDIIDINIIRVGGMWYSVKVQGNHVDVKGPAVLAPGLKHTLNIIFPNSGGQATVCLDTSDASLIARATYDWISRLGLPHQEISSVISKLEIVLEHYERYPEGVRSYKEMFKELFRIAFDLTKDLIGKILGWQVKYFMNAVPVAVDFATFMNARTDYRPDPCIEVTTAPAQPPESTVEPPSILRIVYSDNGNIWIIEGDAPPRQLTYSGLDTEPILSDDARVVAFMRKGQTDLATDQYEISWFELWAVNTDGSSERALVTTEWLDSLYPRPSDEYPLLPIAIIGTLEWIPQSHTLAFNTMEVTDFFPTRHNDFHLLDTDKGTLTTLLPPIADADFRSAIVWFSYSPNGQQIALISPTTISLMMADGSARRDLITYELVNTESDRLVLASVQWSPDSTFLQAAIPSRDTFVGPNIYGTLWHIPANGSQASILNTVQGNFAAWDSLFYSPDLKYIAFTRGVGDPEDYDSHELHIANGDGSNDIIYASDPALSWWISWAPNSRRFLYAMIGKVDKFGYKFFVAELGADPRPLAVDVPNVHDPRWVSDEEIIFLSKLPSSGYELRIGALDGTSRVIVSFSDYGYDFKR